MTPEQQRLALAKWAGFKMCPVHLAYECCGNRVPDFLNDLNAVHELMARLDSAQYDGESGFTQTLAMVTQGPNAPINGWRFRPMQEATAAQRCEALLRTLGLWED